MAEQVHIPWMSHRSLCVYTTAEGYVNTPTVRTGLTSVRMKTARPSYSKNSFRRGVHCTTSRPLFVFLYSFSFFPPLSLSLSLSYCSYTRNVLTHTSQMWHVVLKQVYLTNQIRNLIEFYKNVFFAKIYKNVKRDRIRNTAIRQKMKVKGSLEKQSKQHS